MAGTTSSDQQQLLTVGQLLKVPQVRGLLTMQAIHGLSRDKWKLEAIYFVEVFGLTPVAAGSWLASIYMLGKVGQTLMGGVETALIAAKVPTLTIRRNCSSLAWLLAAALEFAFMAARTPLQATACMALTGMANNLHSAGYHQALREGGGADSGTLAGLWNTLPHLFSIVVPTICLLVRKRFGWRPLFWYGAGHQLLLLVLYRRVASVQTARQMLEQNKPYRRGR